MYNLNDARDYMRYGVQTMKSREPMRTDMAMLRPKELSERIKAAPLVYIPSGIFEWHDAQNPLGTDTLKMVEICRRAAEKTGGLVHRPSYVGVGAFFDPIGPLRHGGLNFSAALVASYLTELFEQLDKLGFELIVLLYGHTNPGNINAHEQAASDYLKREETRAKVLCLNDCEPAVCQRYKVADHAAKWETSFMMAAHPDAVRMENIPPDHGDWWGLDPREHASPEEGERMYEIIADGVTEIAKAARNASVQELIDGTFSRRRECWRSCRNISDLKDDFWKGDEKWEDPFCFFCMWRSPGVIEALVDIKGIAWVRRRIELWNESSKSYTGRFRTAWTELKKEFDSYKGSAE